MVKGENNNRHFEKSILKKICQTVFGMTEKSLNWFLFVPLSILFLQFDAYSRWFCDSLSRVGVLRLENFWLLFFQQEIIQLA